MVSGTDPKSESPEPGVPGERELPWGTKVIEVEGTGRRARKGPRPSPLMPPSRSASGVQCLPSLTGSRSANVALQTSGKGARSGRVLIARWEMHAVVTVRGAGPGLWHRGVLPWGHLQAPPPPKVSPRSAKAGAPPLSTNTIPRVCTAPLAKPAWPCRALVLPSVCALLGAWLRSAACSLKHKKHEILPDPGDSFLPHAARSLAFEPKSLLQAPG